MPRRKATMARLSSLTTALLIFEKSPSALFG